MNIEERVNVAILMKYYGKILTDKQREILSMYVDNNLSLQEVSEELNISRQAVKDTLDKAINILNKTEDSLKFISRDKRIISFINNKSNKEIDETTKKQLLSILEDE